MKKLLLSVAIAGCLAAPVLAQSTDGVFRTEMTPTDVMASDLIGMRIYATETQVSGNATSGVQPDWQDIGEVNDVVLSRDGKVEAVLVDIGGFLGIGERRVAVQMSALRFLSDDATPDSTSDYFLVLNAGRSVLEGAPIYGESAVMTGSDAPAQGGLSDGQPPVIVDKDGQATVGAADTATGASDGAMQGTTNGGVGSVHEGFAPLAGDQITTEALRAAEIYDTRENRVGKISDLILDASGKVSQVVIDFGGFLGMGEKRVALPLSDVQIMKATDNETSIRIYVPHSEDQLKNMPAYEG